jgi:RHS repeat-associated protein
MVMPGRNDLGSSDYRYSFQGQEKDDEIKGDGNSINYKYRMHDPRVGRFFAVDPLASKYPHNGPYNFSENIVIHGVELEGLEVVKLTGEPEIFEPWLITGTHDLSARPELKKYISSMTGIELQESFTYEVNTEQEDIKIGDPEIVMMDKGQVYQLTTFNRVTTVNVVIRNQNGEIVDSFTKYTEKEITVDKCIENCGEGEGGGGGGGHGGGLGWGGDGEEEEEEKKNGTFVDTTWSRFDTDSPYAGDTMRTVTTTKYEDGEIIEQTQDHYIQDDLIYSDTTVTEDN